MDILPLGIIACFDGEILREDIPGGYPVLWVAISLYESTGTIVLCACDVVWGDGLARRVAIHLSRAHIIIHGIAQAAFHGDGITQGIAVAEIERAFQRLFALQDIRRHKRMLALG